MIRHGAGILKWTKKELYEKDIKINRVMVMNKELHPRSNFDILYVSRTEG